MLEPVSVTCPYCWETLEIVVDLSVPEQRYVEDCSVCCQPIVIAYHLHDDGSIEMDATREGGE
jgi:hypothetical protein